MPLGPAADPEGWPIGSGTGSSGTDIHDFNRMDIGGAFDCSSDLAGGAKTGICTHNKKWNDHPPPDRQQFPLAGPLARAVSKGETFGFDTPVQNRYRENEDVFWFAKNASGHTLYPEPAFGPGRITKSKAVVMGREQAVDQLDKFNRNKPPQTAESKAQNDAVGAAMTETASKISESVSWPSADMDRTPKARLQLLGDATVQTGGTAPDTVAQGTLRAPAPARDGADHDAARAAKLKMFTWLASGERGAE